MYLKMAKKNEHIPPYFKDKNATFTYNYADPFLVYQLLGGVLFLWAFSVFKLGK